MIHKIRLYSIILIIFLLFITPMGKISKAQAGIIQLSSQSFTLAVNHYKTLYVTRTSNKVTWSSSNKTIAVVSSIGRVTAKAPGSAIIYASVAGKRLSCKVTVIKLNTVSAALAAGTTKTLKVYGTTNTVKWSSGNQTIATVSSGGKVTAKAPGKVTIYAAVSGKKLSCSITVVKLNTLSATLSIGASKNLKVYGTSSTVTWSSSNNVIASVNRSGVVSAKTAGTTSITASVLGIKLNSKIIVNKPSVPTPTPAVTPISTIESSLSVPDKKIIGYYAAWKRYSGFTPDKIDVTKLTHINYAFANIGSDLKIELGYPDIDSSNINILNEQKLINPNLKTIISIGGYSWSKRFSDVSLTEEARSIFADSCVDFVVKYGFDGIDIDWEYPVAGGLSTNVKRPEDKHNFTLLLKTLREKLDERGVTDGKEYILSFAGAAGSWYLRNIEISQIIPYVDYINVMTYDLHGPWETYTNFNAPLFSNDPRFDYISTDKSIRNWLNAGVPKNKLVMGVPFYGYLYKATADVNHGFNQTYSGSSSISFKNIVANYRNAPAYIHYYHSNSRVPWLFNGSTFITYEDEQSMMEKARYIKEYELSGVMIWELSQDYNNILLNSLYQNLR